MLLSPLRLSVFVPKVIRLQNIDILVKLADTVNGLTWDRLLSAVKDACGEPKANEIKRQLLSA